MSRESYDDAVALAETIAGDGLLDFDKYSGFGVVIVDRNGEIGYAGKVSEDLRHTYLVLSNIFRIAAANAGRQSEGLPGRIQ